MLFRYLVVLVLYRKYIYIQCRSTGTKREANQDVHRFFAVCVGVSFVYYTRFLKIDDEEFGRFEMMKEGLFPAFAVFLLSWIISYNALHV